MGSDERACPFCAETVKAAAVVCKHCGSRIDGEPAPSTAPLIQPPRAAVAEGENGYRLSVGFGALIAVVVIALFALVWLVAPTTEPSPPPQTPAQSAEETFTTKVEDSIRTRLRDPDSAVFKWLAVVPSRGKACGTVNARNGFGGYSGEDQVSYDNGKVLLMSDDLRGFMVANSECLVADAETAIARIEKQDLDRKTRVELIANYRETIASAKALKRP